MNAFATILLAIGVLFIVIGLWPAKQKPVSINGCISKELRHIIYRRALELYEKGFADGMCYCIIDAATSHNVVRFSEETFPEFFAHRPIHKPLYKPLYWFPCHDRKSRINVLNTCIDETKP